MRDVIPFDIWRIKNVQFCAEEMLKMKPINFTEFRSPASDMMPAQQPSWKKPALRLSSKGAGLAVAIIKERSLPARRSARVTLKSGQKNRDGERK
jgi:hypothetical protein